MSDIKCPDAGDQCPSCDGYYTHQYKLDDLTSSLAKMTEERDRLKAELNDLSRRHNEQATGYANSLVAIDKWKLLAENLAHKMHRFQCHSGRTVYDYEDEAREALAAYERGKEG